METNLFYQGETVKEITQNELIALLLTIKGATFASFQMFSSESKSKSDKGQKILNKRSFNAVQLNSDYYDKLNKRLAKEGKEAIKEDEKISPNYDKVNGSNVVVQYKKDNSFGIICQIEGKVQSKAVHYDREGNEVAKDQLQNYFTPSGWKQYSEVTNQSEQRGLENEDNKFFHFVPKLSNIEYFKVNGVVYKIKH